MDILITSKPKQETDYVYNHTYIYIISAVAALGGLLFGFDLVIISGTIPFFQAYFNLNESFTGLAVGCISLGAALGALVSGPLSTKLGIKKVLKYSAFLFVISGVGTGWATDFTLFILFRVLSGVAVGAAALLCPMYIAEISPSPMRGKMVSFYQLSIVIGIMLAYILNYVLLETGQDNWRWMFTSQSLPAVLFFISLFFVSESPRWLIGKAKIKEALTILRRIGGSTYASTESTEIMNSYVLNSSTDFKQLFKRDIWPIVLIGIVIAACSQAVGQNSLFSYAPILFAQAGMEQNTAFQQSIIIGLVNIIFTFFAISKVDKFGRKKLLYWGAVLLCLDSLALAASFYWQFPASYVLFFLLAFIAIYSATLGPATWVVLSEIFPNRIRGNAMALSTLVLWITNFFATASFPIMKEQFGLPLTFIIHALICLGYGAFIYSKVPETKGKTLEQIEQIFFKKVL
jgi:sugar porter (SP) family MFS transporter